MKRNFSLIIAVIAWFAVISQYVLMVENRVESLGETTIRFFSFFTILTNTLVAVYFTLQFFQFKRKRLSIFYKVETLTAVTVYITIVGLVYQLVLRGIWSPTGMQKVVDELLHSIIPVLVIAFWYLFQDSSKTAYEQILNWLIYPFVYLLYVLIRGHFSEFYPYPFVNVVQLGFPKVLINSTLLIFVFICVSALFIVLGKIGRKRSLE